MMFCCENFSWCWLKWNLLPPSCEAGFLVFEVLESYFWCCLWAQDRRRGGGPSLGAASLENPDIHL